MRQGELFAPREPIAAYVDRWAPVLGRLATERKARELAELEAAELLEQLQPDWNPAPGDLVRFTEAALRSMYGSKPLTPVKAPSKRWHVVACPCGMCARGEWLALSDGRHAARVALERVPRTRPGCVRREDRDAVRAEMRAQLGVWQDEDGVWWVRAPC